MDHYDAVLCLDYLLESEHRGRRYFAECKSKLDLCRLTLSSSNSASSSLTEAEQALLREEVAFVENALNVRTRDLYAAATSSGVLQKSFYLHHGVGVVPYEKVIGTTSFQVRGRSYCDDNKKVTSRPPLFLLRSIQIVSLQEFTFHVAKESWCVYPKHDHDSEWLVVNYMIPGSTNVQVVALYSATSLCRDRMRNYLESHSVSPSLNVTPASSLKQTPPPAHTHTKQPIVADFLSREERSWLRCLSQFWTAERSFCDERFKLIPAIVEGNWTVKMAVGNKPALTGKKLTQQYFRGKGYFEVDIDIASSAVAVGILSMVRGVSKNMVVDLGITIQGESEDELPEAVLCQTRFDRVDLESAIPV